MSSFLPSVVDRLQAKAREFLRPANRKIGIPVFRLRESTASKLKDMPWCPRVPQLTPEELQLLHMLHLGVPDKVIQAILRHEDVSTTQRSYIKTVPQVVTDAMKQLEARIARAAVVQQLAVN
jgi:integrase